MTANAEMTATRRLQFCAGHRVHRHESKCRNLHGHNYVGLFSAGTLGGELDALGRVIDFSHLKARLGQWIDENWDHGMILWDQDKEGIAAVREIPGQKLFLMSGNPTAENMAQYLLDVVGPQALVGTGVRLVEVTLWETENCYATVRANVR
jgi:6-pyruvoyltetrahydropterin/6-carboxytetrahydropterin synthase